MISTATFKRKSPWLNNMKSHRERKNLLTKKQIAEILASIGERHGNVLSDANCRKTLIAACKKEGMTAGATSNAIRVHSVKVTGNAISVQGFRRSQLLHEIGGGTPWESIERKFGAQMVKTACADFVRQFSPKVIIDNLSGKKKRRRHETAAARSSFT